MSESIGKKQVVSSLWWKMLERFLTQGVGLVVQIVLARILLPSDFGSMAIMVAIINYLGIFVQSGLSTTVIQRKNLGEMDVSSLLSMSLLLALGLYVLLFFSAPLIGRIYKMEDIIWPIRVLSVSLFLSAINSIQIGILSRHMKFRIIFSRSIISIVVAGLVAIYMALKGLGIWALVAYSLLNIAIVVITMSFVPEVKIKFGICWYKVKELYSFSIKIIFTNLVSGGGDTLRTMVIGKKYTTSQLAYYDKAYTYSNTATQIVTASISGVLLPTFSRQQDDVARLKEMVRKSMKLTAFLSFPLLLGLLVIAKPLVLLLLTEKWAPCIPFLMIFCVFRLCGPISTIDKQVFYSLGRSDIGLYYEIGLLIANVTMLICMLSYGIMAIAIGATVVEFFGNFVIFIISQHIYGYTLKERAKDYIKPIVNSLVMMAFMWPISLLGLSNLVTIIIQCVIGFVVYYIICLVTKDDNLIYIKNIIKNK